MPLFKRFRFPLWFVIITISCFSACEKDDNRVYPENTLVGTYMFKDIDQFYTTMFTEGGLEVPFTDSEYNEAINYSREMYSKTVSFQFYKNGEVMYRDSTYYFKYFYHIKDSIIYLQIKNNLYYKDTTFQLARFSEGKIVTYYGLYYLFKEGNPIYHNDKWYMNPINILDTALRKLRYPSINVLLKDDLLLIESHRMVYEKI